jgi:GTP-binding protein
LKASQQQNAQEATDDSFLDTGDLERERGITIMSKATRIGHGQYSVNVVDTPGHADFGGEVERVLSMVNGVLLLVDATEGPMPQTKFVVGKALAAGLPPILVVNKVDRDSARLDGEVENEVWDLFVSLGATDEQLEYPTIYASGRAGWATEDLDQALEWAKNPPGLRMHALMDAIVNHIPPPCGVETLSRPFSLAVNNIGSDTFLGPLVTGRIESGTVEVGQMARCLSRGTSKQAGDAAKVTQVFVTRGLTKEPLGRAAGAGDIVTVAGIRGEVGDTIGGLDLEAAIETPAIPPPTLSMTFGANDGPLSGREGTKLTASLIKARLQKEVENNVTVRIEPSKLGADKMDVFGRGELQLGILIETMRREGFEFCVSPPRVLMTQNGDVREEPLEEVTIDVDSEYSGVVIDKLTGARKGNLIDVSQTSSGKSRLLFEVTSRGLLGFAAEIRSDTRGTAIVNSVYARHVPYAGQMGSLSPGKLVSMERGTTTAYALSAIQDRGKLFVSVGEDVYDGMVIGENSRPGDMEVNPCRAKRVTNVRSVTADEKLTVAPPVRMTVEEVISYMGDDEVIEITPKNFRLRKAALEAGQRARNQKSRAK